MRRTIVTVGLAAALVALSTLLLEVAQAQYPPPTGSLTLRASTATPAVGSVLGVSATALDQTGAPVAGVACSFEIISQPGNDATVDRGPIATDANGVANTTLNVGSTPGNIVVGARCGELSSQVLVSAGAAAPAVQLPATGQGPDGSRAPDWLTSVALGGLGALALGLGLRRALPRKD